MKRLLSLFSLFIVLNINAQSKWSYTTFTKITELEGTDYMVCTASNDSKKSPKGKGLLFIHTLTGDATPMDFSKDFYFDEIKVIHLENLGLHKVLISGRIMEDKSKLSWDFKKSLFICSIDGKERVEIPDENFFIQSWEVNKKTGILVIAGHVDTNKNGKYDKTDENEIRLYSLKDMKMIRTL
ncbi:MAG: hypothetical protein LUH22_08000 [Bacteroides sp.]|nr:hypothetical protein [Bacteroides sp.]